MKTSTLLTFGIAALSFYASRLDWAEAAPKNNKPIESAPIQANFRGAEVIHIALPQTHSMLKIKIRPKQGKSKNAERFHPHCVSYQVRLGGKVLRTKPLTMDSKRGSTNCPGALEEDILDFSDRLTLGTELKEAIFSAVETDVLYQQCEEKNASGASSECKKYFPMSRQHKDHATGAEVRFLVN